MSNPVFTSDVFNAHIQSGSNTAISSNTMTVDGTIDKSIWLLSLVSLSAFIFYIMPENLALISFIPASILALIAGFVIAFKPTTAPIVSNIYALLEGVCVGTITKILCGLSYASIAQAILATLAVIFIVFVTYRLKIVKVTNNFMNIVFFATLGTLFFYLIRFFLSIIGFNGFLMSNGVVDIGINLIICGIAASNLFVDFEIINRSVRQQAPKYMEWYCAYGLMVTIIWLYIEILKLFRKR